MSSATSLLELVKNKRKAIEANKGRGRTTKPPVGKSKWRILPGWRGGGDDTFFHDFALHYIKDSSGKTAATYICSEKTFGSACPVCEAISEGIRLSTDDRTVKLLNSAKATGRILVNAICTSESGSSPVILELPVTVFQNYLGIMASYMEDHNINILDTDKGFDVTIEKTGSGLDTEYSVIPSPVSTKIDPEVLKKLHNLDTYVAQENEVLRLKAMSAVKKVVSEKAPSLSGPTSSAAVTKHSESVASMAGAAGVAAERPASVTIDSEVDKAPATISSDEVASDLGDLNLDDVSGIDLDGIDLSDL